MPKFRYKAIDDTGNMVEREAVYPSEEVLLGELARSGFSLVRIERIDKEEKEKKSIEIKLPFGGGVSDQDISIFCRQLSTMINAGLSVVDALDIIAEQLPNKRLSEAAKDVSTKVREGMSISSAMQMHPRVFPEFVVNLVKVGEETGGLDVSLLKAAEYYEKIAMIKSKIKSASFYPTFVVVVRTMAILFSSGVALERAFEIAGQTAGNIIIKEAVDQARKAVTEGEPMYRALEKTGLFPKIVIAMVRVGEDTGRLDDMLETIARFYEDEFDKTVEGLIKLIEPMLIVFIGGVVGLILIALYMPIFKLGELIKS
jgi:type II secretory pathway component PulF